MQLTQPEQQVILSDKKEKNFVMLILFWFYFLKGIPQTTGTTGIPSTDTTQSPTTESPTTELPTQTTQTTQSPTNPQTTVGAGDALTGSSSEAIGIWVYILVVIIALIILFAVIIVIVILVRKNKRRNYVDEDANILDMAEIRQQVGEINDEKTPYAAVPVPSKPVEETKPEETKKSDEPKSETTKLE